MRRNEVDEGFVRRVMNNAEQFTRDLQISIVDHDRTPLPVNAQAFFDTAASQRLFQLINVGYASEKARDRDIRSVEIVMKRRAGFKTSMVFKSKHLLVTNNELLSSATQRLSSETTGHKEYVPAALHRRRMSATLWLQLGSERRRAIARKQLVASCSDVIRIRPEIIAKLRSRLDAVDPQKAAQFDVMIRQPRYQQLAMDLTFSNEAIASETDAIAIFGKLQEEMTLAERLRQEEAHRQERDQVAVERAVERGEYSLRLTNLETQVSDARKTAVGAQEEALNALKGAVTPYFDRCAGLTKFALFAAITIILFFTAVGGLITIYGDHVAGSFAMPVKWGAFITAGILTIMSIFGRDVHWLKKPILRYYQWQIRNRAITCGLVEPIQVDISARTLTSGDGRTYSIRSILHLNDLRPDKVS
jgi:hypothetical protein